MKKVAMLLFAVTVCIFLLFVVSYYRDIKGEQVHLLAAKDVAVKLAEKSDKIETLEGILKKVKEANITLEQKLTNKSDETDVAIREQKRLETKLGEARSAKNSDIRKYDLIGLDYTLLQKVRDHFF